MKLKATVANLLIVGNGPLILQSLIYLDTPLRFFEAIYKSKESLSFSTSIRYPLHDPALAAANLIIDLLHMQLAFLGNGQVDAKLISMILEYSLRIRETAMHKMMFTGHPSLCMLYFSKNNDF